MLKWRARPQIIKAFLLVSRERVLRMRPIAGMEEIAVMAWARRLVEFGREPNDGVEGEIPVSDFRIGVSVMDYRYGETRVMEYSLRWIPRRWVGSKIQPRMREGELCCRKGMAGRVEGDTRREGVYGREWQGALKSRRLWPKITTMRQQ